jgi:hypothetical protein
MESLAARRDWLTSRYNINLGHKPSNSSNATAKSLFHPTESFPQEKHTLPYRINERNKKPQDRPISSQPTHEDKMSASQ